MMVSPSKAKIFGVRPEGMKHSRLPRKISKVRTKESVPQSDTGGHVEKTKANE